MLPVAPQASHKDLLSSIAGLSEFSLAVLDEENRRDCQAADRPVECTGWSESLTRCRSSYDTKCRSGTNGPYLAQIVTHCPSENYCITGSIFNPTSSSSINTANEKSPSHLQGVNQPGHAIHKEITHSIKKNKIMKSQYCHTTRQDLLKRLEQGYPEGGLGDELKVMINMMERMNTILRGLSGIRIVGAPKINMNACTINQGIALATQMKHYFNTLGQQYECQIHNITQIRSYLPILGPDVKSTLVRTALKIWNERIIITYVDRSDHLLLPLTVETLPLPCPKSDPNKRKLIS